MALIALVLVPLLTGLGLIALGQGLRTRLALDLALGATLVTTVLAIAAAITRPSFDRAWLPDLDVRTRLVVDGISIPLILLTAAIGILVALHARSELPEGGSPATFLGCLLVVEGGALATFLAGDAVLFFVAFELVLVPMWVLITRFGDPHRPAARTEAGHRFVLYTAVGSTLMLVGILLLVTSAGTSNLTELMAAGAALPPGRQLTIALLLTIGLCVKVPAFPLHTWLPSAHTIAPTAGSVVLAAVLLKMGTYGLVRLPVSVVPGGFERIAPWVGLVGVIGIIWGSLVCLVERDLKRLIAYSSVAHMGFVLLGISTGTEIGLQAALYGNLAHGVISALLFVVVGGLKRRWGVVDLGVVLPALREIAPRRGFFLILGLAAALGLPGLAGFWGEFLAIVAAWGPANTGQVGFFRTYAVLAAVGGALAAAYCLRVARLLWVGDAVPDPGLGDTSTPSPVERTNIVGSEGPEATIFVHSTREVGSLTRDVADVGVETRGSERVVLVVLSVAVFALGLMPWFAMALMRPAVALIIGGHP